MGSLEGIATWNTEQPSEDRGTWRPMRHQNSIAWKMYDNLNQVKNERPTAGKTLEDSWLLRLISQPVTVTALSQQWYHGNRYVISLEDTKVAKKAHCGTQLEVSQISDPGIWTLPKTIYYIKGGDRSTLLDLKALPPGSPPIFATYCTTICSLLWVFHIFLARGENKAVSPHKRFHS